MQKENTAKSWVPVCSQTQKMKYSTTKIFLTIPYGNFVTRHTFVFSLASLLDGNQGVAQSCPSPTPPPQVVEMRCPAARPHVKILYVRSLCEFANVYVNYVLLVNGLVVDSDFDYEYDYDNDNDNDSAALVNNCQHVHIHSNKSRYWNGM